MRVLHITTEFPPVIRGGLGAAVGGLVSASARAGITVGVLFLNGAQLVEGWWQHSGYASTIGLPKVESEQLTGPARVSIFQIDPSVAVENAVRVVEQWRPDVLHLHIHWEWPFIKTIVERAVIPLVYTLHSIDRAEYETCLKLDYNAQYLLEYIEGQEEILARATRVLTLTASERGLLARYYPAARDKVRVVGNGVDDCEGAWRVRRKAGDDASPLVLYVGRLVERKGIRDLVAAIPRILERVPRTRFVIAGGPPPSGVAELERRWLTPDCAPYREQIRFTGWLSGDKLRELYRAADILVVPSWYEPFGMVVLEGMLYGLPIVASATGGPLEILDEGRTGLLFPPANVDALQQAVCKLLMNPNRRRQMGRAAAREVKRRWLWSHVVERILGVYCEVVSSRVRPVDERAVG